MEPDPGEDTDSLGHLVKEAKVSYDGDSWAPAVPSVTSLHRAATLTPLCVQTPSLPASSSEVVWDFGRSTTHLSRDSRDTLALQKRQRNSHKHPLSSPGR